MAKAFNQTQTHPLRSRLLWCEGHENKSGGAWITHVLSLDTQGRVIYTCSCGRQVIYGIVKTPEATHASE